MTTKLTDDALRAHAALNALIAIMPNTVEAQRLFGIVRAGLPELPEGASVGALPPAQTDHEVATDLRVAEVAARQAEVAAAVPVLTEAPKAESKSEPKAKADVA